MGSGSFSSETEIDYVPKEGTYVLFYLCKESNKTKKEKFYTKNLTKGKIGFFYLNLSRK